MKTETRFKQALKLLGEFQQPPKPSFTLSSGIPRVDGPLKGGFTPGLVVEWGLPEGRWGRAFMLRFLRGKIPPTLWAHGEGERVYPPAFAGHGLDLRRVVFYPSDTPQRELAPVFLEETFKILILDNPKNLRPKELSFLRAQVRKKGQVLFLIRPFFLSSKLGNPFSHLRLNAHYQEGLGFTLHFLKGGYGQTLNLSLRELLGSGDGR